MSAKSTTKKINQESTYCSDIFLPNMQYAALLRSNKKNGIIRSLTLPTLPEGYFYFSEKDIPGKKTLTINETEVSIFAGNYVRYEGDVVGILVGPEEHVVCQLRDAAEIDIETLPFKSFDIADTQNTAARREVLQGNPEAEFDECFVSENTYSIPQDLIISDTYSAIAKCGKKNEWYLPSYLTNEIVSELSKVLCVKEDTIYVNKTLTNNNTLNAGWQLAVLLCQVAVASTALKEAVKITLTHSEQKKYYVNSTLPIIKHRTIASHSGKIHTMLVDIYFDAGIYSPYIQTILDRASVTSCGAYTPENLRIQAYALNTNSPPADFSINYSDMLAVFAIEAHVRAILAETDIDPVELRKTNILPDKQRQSFFSFNSAEKVEQLIDVAVQKSDFMRKFMSYKMIISNQRTKNVFPTRGIGSALGFSSVSYFNTTSLKNKIFLKAEIQKNGSLVFYMHEPPVHIKCILFNLVKSSLQINKDNIVFLPANNKNTLSDIDSILIHSNACIFLVEKICRKLKTLQQDQEVPLTVIEKMPTVRTKWDSKSFSGTPFTSVSWGVAVAEIETDTSLFTASIKKISLFIDAGEIFNERMARDRVKQTAYTVIQRLGFNKTNETEIKIVFIQSHDDFKDFSGLCENIIPAAVFNALSQAIGKNITVAPLHSQLMYASIE